MPRYSSEILVGWLLTPRFSGQPFPGTALVIRSECSFCLSATRGSPGLMSWAYIILQSAAVTSLTVTLILGIGARHSPAKKMKFTKFWKFVAAAAIWSSFLGGMVGMLLLNLSIFELHFPRDQTGERVDSPLDYGLPTSPPMIFAFVLFVLWFLIFFAFLRSARISPLWAVGVNVDAWLFTSSWYPCSYISCTSETRHWIVSLTKKNADYSDPDISLPLSRSRS